MRKSRQVPGFAVRIRQIRLSAGLTPEQAAERAGISWIYWRQIETGVRTNPGVNILQKMAEALGCQVADFWTNPALSDSLTG